MSAPISTVRFLLLGSGARVGSTLIFHALREHPDITCYWEVFNRRRFPQSFTEDGATRMEEWFSRGETQAVGFKLFLSQARVGKSQSVWTAAAADRDIRVIRLRREGTFSQYVSYQAALRTSQWHHGVEDQPEFFKLRLRPDACVEFIREQRRLEAWADQVFGGHRQLEIGYERDIENGPPEQVFSRIVDFLGLPPRNLPVVLRKSAVGSIAERVENYDEVLAVLKRAGLAG